MSQGLLDYSHVSQPLSKFTCSNIKAPLSHYELIFEMMNQQILTLRFRIMSLTFVNSL